MSATRRPARRTTTRRRSTTRRRTTTRSTRRRTPRLTTTVGAALGALVASFLLDLGWGARIAILVAVVLVAIGYLLWSHRAEVAAGAEQPAAAPPADPTTPPTTPEQP